MKNLIEEYISTAAWGGFTLEQLDIHEGTMSDGKTKQKQRNRLMRDGETAMYSALQCYIL